MPVYAEKELVNGQKRWYIRTYITDDLGHKKQITRHNKLWIGRDGKKEAEWEENKIKNIPYLTNKKNKTITLHELKEEYIDSLIGKLDSDTIYNKKTMLNHFCENDNTNQVITYPNIDIKKINETIYEEFQKQMKNKKYKHGKILKNYSILQLNRINNTISAMIEYAILNNYCSYNFVKKCGKIGTPKEIKMSRSKKTYNVIDFEEYQKLMKYSQKDLKYNTFFDLEFSRGPRIGEVRAFRICDYNYEKKQLIVNHTMSKKNILKYPKTIASKAPIDLDDSLNEKIFNLIENLKKKKGFDNNWYIFGGKKPISAHALENAKEKYFKLANINKHIRIHDFRHSCATWLLSIKTPVEVISKILRHASIRETMETYAHLLDNVYQSNLEILNNIKEKQDQKQD